MPLEGQWRRANTPLRQLGRRERLVVAGGAVSMLIAVVVLLLIAGGRSQAPPGPGCIRATIPQVMGAEQLNACGQRARRLCAQSAKASDPGGKAIAASCRNAGIRLAG
jgi:hypothetical protein